jgi:DNA adenine methylase
VKRSAEQRERSVPSRALPVASLRYGRYVPPQTATNAAPRIRWDELLRRRSIHSPLRYPGGKRRLVPYVAAGLAANELKPDLFVEPFAGGASVGLELAASGAVAKIGIADLDPYVAAFWQTTFFDCDWLCEQVENIDVTLATWERMKRARFRSQRSMALACLFLNRTSFNGALHRRAGPIGGKRGKSKYGLDCRFPRARLVQRLRACEQLATKDKVAFVRCATALETIRFTRDLATREGLSLFFYLDPPFWAKSHLLYRYSFDDAGHRELAEALRWVHEHYLLSYDAAPEVQNLYRQHGVQTETVELLYTATQRSAGFELVITNLELLPADTKLWRTNGEWRKLRAAPLARQG